MKYGNLVFKVSSPAYWIKSSHYLVLGWPRGLLCPQGIHSVTDCPSVFAFSYAPDVCHITLFVDPVCTLSVLEGDSYHDSLHLPLGCDQFLKLGVATRPSLTAICHYWEYTFVKYFPLQFHWHIFVSHGVVQLTECIPSLSNSTFQFLYLVMVLSDHLPEIYVFIDLLDLLSIDNHIILVDMHVEVLPYSPR